MTTSSSTSVFAACRIAGELVVKRVPVHPTVQSKLPGEFDRQETSFRTGIMEEVPFDGGWKADSNELLTIDLTPEAEELTAEVDILQNAVESNAISIQEIDTANFTEENIKGVFIRRTDKLLVQRFTSGQVLSRKFALIFRGNTFREMIDPAFTLSSSLVCIVENNRIKFKSFANLRSIFDLREVYREATDEDVRDFAGHENLLIEDADNFVENSRQPMRKIISAILGSEILDKVTSQEVKDAAATTGLNINLQNGRIVLPQEYNEAMDVLKFLNEDRWLGLLSSAPYITNSKKRV